MPVQYYMPIAQPQLVTSMYQPHNLINSSLLHSNNNNLNNKPKEHKVTLMNILIHIEIILFIIFSSRAV